MATIKERQLDRRRVMHQNEQRQEQRGPSERERTYSDLARHWKQSPAQGPSVVYRPIPRWCILLSRGLKRSVVRGVVDEYAKVSRKFERAGFHPTNLAQVAQ